MDACPAGEKRCMTLLIRSVSLGKSLAKDGITCGQRQDFGIACGKGCGERHAVGYRGGRGLPVLTFRGRLRIISVVSFPLSRMPGGVNGIEADISTAQASAEAGPWFSQADGQSRRAQGPAGSAAERKKAPVCISHGGQRCGFFSVQER